MIEYRAKDGTPISFAEFCVLRQDRGYAHVRATALDDEVTISTVWLGLDHGFGRAPREVFETMVGYGGIYSGRQWRWPDLEAAEAGHDVVVALMRDELGMPAARDHELDG